MNKSQPFRLSRIFIALVATTGILVNPVFASESSQPASQYTKQQNQRYLTSLPLPIAVILTMRSVVLSHHCLTKVFLKMPTENPFIAQKIISLISMPLHQKQ